MKIQLRKQVGAVLGLALFVVSFAAFADEVVPVELTTQLSPLVAPGADGGDTAFTAAEENVTLGNVRLHLNKSEQNGASVSFEVGADKTLTIERLRGGRGRSASLTKTGAGTLRLKDAAPYGGTVVLQGGTLDLSVRKVPTAAELPAEPILHVDASDLSNFTTEEEGGTTYVKWWKNDPNAKGDVKGLQQYACISLPTYFRPWLVRDAMGPGLHAVDFGLCRFEEPFKGVSKVDPATPWPVKCGAMSFATEEDYETDKSVGLAGVKTLVAVVGAHRGGGTLLNYSGSWGSKPFDRGGNWIGSSNWRSGIAKDYTKGSDTYPATAYQDGRPVDATAQFDSPAYHVIAIKQDSAGASAYRFCCSSDGNGYIYPGGGLVAEAFVYDRDLTDAEIRDVQAYLMDKWFKMTAGGYRDPRGQASIQKLTVAADSTIYIPASQTNRLDTLAVNAPVAVAGGGTLEVFDATLNGTLVYRDGSEIRYVDRPDAGDVLCAVPPGQSFRLDAQSPSSLMMNWDTTTGELKPADGTNQIARAASYGGGNAMAIGAVNYATNYFSGQPVMDFGWKAAYGTMFNTTPMDGVRGVFLVHRGDGATAGSGTEDHSYDGGFTVGGCSYASFLLGDNNNMWDYFRDPNKKGVAGGNSLFFGNNGGDCLQSGWADAWRDGTFYANGTGCRPSGAFELVEFKTRCASHVSAVKCACGRTQYAGSGQIGELVIYERPLTDREQVQMRNYLMKKWFGKTDGELTPLPALPPSKAGVIQPTVIEIAGGTVTLGEETVSNLVFRGYGQIVKTGEETVVQTMDFNGFTGTVEVTEGTLAVTGYQTQREGRQKTDDVIARFVVGEGLETEQVGNVTRVKEWHSTVGDYYLVRAAATDGVCLKYDATIRSDYVNLGDYGMYVYKGGETASIDNIRAVAWALGSQAGGGALMGGHQTAGGTDGIGWHRGDDNVGTPGYDCRDPLIHSGHAQVGLRPASAMWRVNERTVNPTTEHLTGGWDAIGVNETNLTTAAINACALALEPRSSGIRQGHQRLLELVLYSAPMTEEEFLDNEAYLMNKWHLFNAVGMATNVVDLVLAAGTTLSAGGHNQYFKSLEGEGATVADGGIKPAKLVYDFDKAGVLTIDGAFEFRPGFTVELRNAPGAFEPVTVATATTLEGLENYEKVCVTGCAGGPVLVWRWDGANACYRLIVRFEGLNVSGDVSFANETAVTTTVAGAGTVTKAGAGELALRGLSDFEGTLHVAEGRVAVSGTAVKALPELPLEGRIAHFDSNVGLEVAYTASGVNVTKWHSQVGDVCAKAYPGVTCPLLVDEFVGLPAVKIADRMDFTDSANKGVTLEGIQTVLWVIGSQEGGGFVLGGGHSMVSETDRAGYAWHRNGDGQTASQGISCGSAAPEVQNGNWWLNGRAINATNTGLSGAYDQMSWRAAADDKWASASAFASDTRGVAGRQGHQRLAEVVIYNRRLGDEELAAAEAYLNLKWGLNDAILPGDAEVDVIVDADATLDLGGTNHVVRSVSGAGTVEGDVQTKGLAYDFDDPQMLTVDGTFAFGEGFSVAITGTVPADLPNTGVKILSATAFANKENFSRTAVTGVDTEKYVLKLRKDGLYLAPVTGLLLLVR